MPSIASADVVAADAASDHRHPKQCLDLLDLDLANLDRRLNVGVVGDVGHDRLGVGAERGLKFFNRFKIEMAHRDKAGPRTRSRADNAVLDCGTLARGSQLPANHRDMAITITIHIEFAALAVGIE